MYHDIIGLFEIWSYKKLLENEEWIQKPVENNMSSYFYNSAFSFKCFPLDVFVL